MIGIIIGILFLACTAILWIPFSILWLLVVFTFYFISTIVYVFQNSDQFFYDIFTGTFFAIRESLISATTPVSYLWEFAVYNHPWWALFISIWIIFVASWKN